LPLQKEEATAVLQQSPTILPSRLLMQSTAGIWEMKNASKGDDLSGRTGTVVIEGAW
jgi:hypothetical protein